MKIKCDNCNIEFNKSLSRIKNSKHNFCCRKCMGEYNTKTNCIETKCDNCNDTIYIYKYYSLKNKYNYCDSDCMYEHKTKIGTKDVKCTQCGIVFNKILSEISHTGNDFCSSECFHTWRGEKDRSSVNCDICGNEINKTNYDIKINKRYFCSKKCYKEGINGKNNPRYIDGGNSRKTEANKKWSLDVKKMANFTCEKCGDSGVELEAHHILAFSRFPEARLDLDNGACLCKECHKQFHHDYGYINFTDEDYYEFLKENIDG